MRQSVVTGQIVIRFFLDPLTDLRKLIGEIDDTLAYHGHIFLNPGTASKELMTETMFVLRQKASLLPAKAHALPLYNFFAFYNLVPKKEDITKASADLYFISNSVFNGVPKEIHDNELEIRKVLVLSNQ